jgi:hypothetical protein
LIDVRVEAHPDHVKRRQSEEYADDRKRREQEEPRGSCPAPAVKVSGGRDVLIRAILAFRH